MFSLFALIQRYAHLILFVVLEFVSFILIVNFNHPQKDIFIHSSSKLTGSVNKTFSGVHDYFDLRQVNDLLLAENARLIRSQLNQSTSSDNSVDAVNLPFDVIPARIIGQTIHSTRNYITLDKGQKDGVTGSLGLITEKGVVGIIKKSTESFSSAMSILHTQTRLSASIRGTDFFGTVHWDGRDFQKADLQGIPTYASVAKGDTVITNGFSTLFPKDIIIGFVTSVRSDPRQTYHQIELELANDFYDLDYVYIIRNNFAAERQQVELE